MAAATIALENVETCRGQEQPEVTLVPMDEHIRKRANHLWLKRGEQPGSDVNDWLQAEAEVCTKLDRKGAKRLRLTRIPGERCLQR